MTDPTPHHEPFLFVPPRTDVRADLNRAEEQVARLAEALAFAEGEIAGLRANQHHLKRQVWLTHGCPMPALYGDDGEMACNACGIDFKRWTVERILARLMDLHLRRLYPETPRTPEAPA